ncbi:putative RNA helicase/RNAse III [Talaromyces proteolyticus]|uniref:Dicer-like protein 1 n=1 Tax=Talaromyces proteolyticus TaxID=1131652 RepID=A0AAD4L4X9_9EURO|nr:putative RNA helicase/RNAse III [Talaromyces proteolyticus]KAH8705121.1 putative RNA helicase/RNAse III [Talaromyces proteolyticus]
MEALSITEERAPESESESEEDIPDTSPVSGRRAQNAHFKTLLSKVAKIITDEEVKAIEKSQHVDTSTRHLLATQDFAATIHDPREYQIELYEKAKKENTIAVLDTGSGKTLIAVLLMKYIIQNELISRDCGERPRVCFFLVNSVTLVFQQSAVLKNNIDQTVTPLIGDLGVDLWNKEAWSKTLNDSMVIVCTAAILHHSLLNSFVRMEDINLLIFDEAHHTKKEHPYARIIKDSYLKTDAACRPRVFGMTASPINAKGDVVAAALELETLLNSKIATTSNLALLRQVVTRPDEELWKYPIPKEPFKTKLHEILERKYGNMECLSKIFAYSSQASVELGEWCADRIWLTALREESLPKFQGRLSTSHQRLAHEDAVKLTEEGTKRLNDLSDMVVKHELPRGAAIFELLSPKVQLLYQNLSKHFEKLPNSKCIVFTKQRHTAKILEDVFKELSVSTMRPGVLIGLSKSGDSLGTNTTYHQQFKTMMRFKKGELNCLFATSVAEEGLDIPDCNLVVRFDLYETLIQYVQSRGRARHSNSTYALMVEIGNMEHETRLDLVHQSEAVMRRFCESLPKDRMLGYSHDNLDYMLEKDLKKRQYTIRSSGATLTYHSALTILARYASSLQYENDDCPQAHYFVSSVKDMYQCEVILPEKSPVHRLLGKPATQKSLAKQSAAFDTCLLLRKSNLLDEHFISTYHRRLPVMRNAKLAIMSRKTAQYPMMTKATFWKQGRGIEPNALFTTLIFLTPVEPLQRNYASVILLTRERLPQFPEFPIYLEDDIETTIRSIPLTKALTISSNRVKLITTFTLRVFRDLYNKTYEQDTTMMPYWLLPAATEITMDKTIIDPLDIIDWEAIQFVYDNDEVPGTASKPEEMVGRFVYDRWDGKYRYFLTKINPTLRPSDPPPSFLPHRKHMENIMDYGLSLYKKARGIFLSSCDWNQPVFDADLIPLRRNLLEKMTEKERDVERRSVICLEPMVISAIPASTAATCFVMPAILTRLESYLIAQECCSSLDLKVDLSYALEAITKDSDNTEEHRHEQIHLQRGMGKNYERLEFLGDCFLKMATSIALFAQNPFDQEYDFHVNRMCLLCNRNLYNTAKERKLYEYIRSKGFSRRNWYPEGMKLLRGKSNESKGSEEHALGEKTIADVCEAIIGASLLSGGTEHRFDMAVKAVTELVNNDLNDNKSHKACRWADYYQLYSLPPYQTQIPDGFEKKLALQVEEKLGYHFKYPRLLRSAFTHQSFPSAWARVPCYQRLEFLGDSLLDMVCVEDLYERFPDRDPQWLTEHKMAMVSNKFLGTLTVQLGLHTHLQYFSSPLQSQIYQYVEESQLAYENKRSVDFWLSTEDAPKCLPDMLEAYLGAIFVDSEFDFGVIEAFYKKHIKPFFEDMALYDTFANKHPVTFLHNKLSIEFGCIEFSLKAGEIPAVDGAPVIILAAVFVHDEVLAEAKGSSVRGAKMKASQAGLDKLEGLSLDKFRELYRCKCPKATSSKDVVEPEV